jgi:uncharacterized protein YbjT (DUF2867 family)
MSPERSSEARFTRVLVTGATGTTGTRLIPRLAASGLEVLAASRGGQAPAESEGVRFDWHDPTGHPAVLAGVDRVYLLPPVTDAQPELVMLPFLQLARELGVRRVVLHSNSPTPAGGPGIGIVHQAIPGLFDEWAVLRPTWFMQNFSGEHPYARMIRQTSSIVTATGDARVGFIDATDIARAATSVLTDTTAPNTDLVLTGPQTLSFADVAAILSQTSHTTITHANVTRGELAGRYEQVGVPAAGAAFVKVMDSIIASGSEDRRTTAVATATGTPPRSFAQFAAAEFRP